LSAGGNNIGKEFRTAVNLNYCFILASFFRKADMLLN